VDFVASSLNRCRQNLQAKEFLANFDCFSSFELTVLPCRRSSQELDQLRFLDRFPSGISSHRSQDSWLPVFGSAPKSFPRKSKVAGVGFGSDQSIRGVADTSFLNSLQNALSDNLLDR
jgi:hypothetical protein